MLRKLIIFSALTFIYQGCFPETDDEELREYSFRLTNASSEVLEVESYRGDDLMVATNISPSSSYECVYIRDGFLGGLPCFGDSLILRFPNGRGYICDSRINGSDSLSFSDRNPLSQASATQIGENTYEFPITQEDYENAHVLPE